MSYTGELVSVYTFFVSTLKDVGKIYLQTVLDCYSRFAWDRLYTSKLPVAAVHVLNEDVLPFFEEHATAVDAILSDNGREFCGRPNQHPYELFLQREGILTAPRASVGRRATASSSGCTARCSTSTSA